MSRRSCGLPLSYVVLCSSLLLGSLPLHALELDFASAVSRLEAESEVLQAAGEGLVRARAGLEEARGRRGPTLMLDARATRLDSALEADLRPVRDRLGGALGGLGIALPPGFFPESFRLQERQFYNLGLEAVQPLYVGGRIRAGLDAAEFGVEAERSVVEATRGELHRVLTERYFGQVLAAEALAVREQTVLALQRHAEDAARLEAEGLIARAERLRASVALAEALAERDTAREQLTLARSALAALLASEQPVEALTPIPPPPERPDRLRWQQRAEAGNPGLQEASRRLDQAEAGQRAARGERLPSVALFARRELYTADLTLLDPDWAVGLQFSWPLYDAGQRRAREAGARARTGEVAQRLAAGRRDVALLVEQQVTRVLAALDRHATFQATATLADESLRAQQRAFEEGLATSLDVIDAELARARVALGELAARQEAWVAMAALHAAAGLTGELPVVIEAALHEHPR